MLGSGCGGLGFGDHARGVCTVGFQLRLQPLGCRARRFGFLVGATPRFPRFLVFGRHARQGCGFGGLLGAKLLVCEIGRPSLGFDPLAGQASKLLFLGGPRGGCTCQFGGGKLTALGIRQRALLGVDSRTQSDFGETLDMRLLGCGGLGRRLGGGTAQGLVRGKPVGLQASLRGCGVSRGK